jgi:hypothetical protein
MIERRDDRSDGMTGLTALHGVQVLVGPVTLDQGSVHEVVRILHELVVDERCGRGGLGGVGALESSRVA